MTPIHKASQEGDKDKVLQLIKEGTDVNCKGKKGYGFIGFLKNQF